MIVVEILGHLFVQLVFTVGFLLLYGGLISLCNRCFYDACGDAAYGIVRLTGYIGTPIHEYSHALMCLLFGHTVKKVSVFGNSKRSKTLGYVEHTYYRKNLYQQIGNFFIGVSPILAGGAVILLLVRLLTPEMFFAMKRETTEIRVSLAGGFGGVIPSFFSGLGAMLGSFFALQNFLDWRWWLCMVLSFSIAIHMEVSRSDIRSGIRGLGVISAMLLVADSILGFLFPKALAAVTSACVTVGIFVAFVLLIPAVFSLIIGGISLIVIFVRETAQSIKNDQAKPRANQRSLPAKMSSDTKSKE